jgi:hypothetical protein
MGGHLRGRTTRRNKSGDSKKQKQPLGLPLKKRVCEAVLKRPLGHRRLASGAILPSLCSSRRPFTTQGAREPAPGTSPRALSRRPSWRRALRGTRRRTRSRGAIAAGSSDFASAASTARSGRRSMIATPTNPLPPLYVSMSTSRDCNIASTSTRTRRATSSLRAWLIKLAWTPRARQQQAVHSAHSNAGITGSKQSVYTTRPQQQAARTTAAPLDER